MAYTYDPKAPEYDDVPGEAYVELQAELAAMTAERNNWRDLYSKDLIRANEDKDALQAQLTAMTAERDAALAVAERAELNYAPLWDRFCKAEDQLTASEAARGEALLQRDEAEKVLAETADALSDLRFNVWGSRAEAALAKADAIVCQAQAALAEPAETAEKGKSNGV